MLKRNGAFKATSIGRRLTPRAGTALRAAGVATLALTLANCTQSAKLSGRGGIDAKYGVAASPRLYGDGEAIPKGGGRDMVGRPYVVAGRTYVPRENPGYSREGLASWYGVDF